MPSYALDLRAEDLLLAILALLVVRYSVGKASLSELPGIEKAFLGFLIAAGISILSGLWLRTIDKPFMSLFYLLKWLEYFLVFVITTHLALNPRARGFFLKTFFLLGMAVAAYGWWEYFFPASKAVYPNYYRLFERPPFHGDANHIGGFFVLWMGFFIGQFLKAEKAGTLALILVALLFVFFPFIWTYSRKSYFALAGALGFSLLFLKARRRTVFLACLFLISGLLLTRLPERLLDLGEAFTSVDPYHSSWAGNLSMWQQSLWNFDKYFLLGSGLGSRHRLFYESQYVLVLSETGILGFALFSLLVFTLLKKAAEFLRKSPAGEAKTAALGWLVGFIGLLIHNLSCVSFTVSKIAIPFWFLTAVVFVGMKRCKEALSV